MERVSPCSGNFLRMMSACLMAFLLCFCSYNHYSKRPQTHISTGSSYSGAPLPRVQDGTLQVAQRCLARISLTIMCLNTDCSFPGNVLQLGGASLFGFIFVLGPLPSLKMSSGARAQGGTHSGDQLSRKDNAKLPWSQQNLASKKKEGQRPRRGKGPSMRRQIDGLRAADALMHPICVAPARIHSYQISR